VLYVPPSSLTCDESPIRIGPRSNGTPDASGVTLSRKDKAGTGGACLEDSCMPTTRQGARERSQRCRAPRQGECMGLHQPHRLEMTALSLPFAAEAQQPIVYPARGQSTQQQSQDEAQCSAWAKHSTGIDPAVVASSPPPQQTGPAVGGGQRLGGAARGVAGGAAIGRLRETRARAPRPER
jgi:hypothetical protein